MTLPALAVLAVHEARRAQRRAREVFVDAVERRRARRALAQRLDRHAAVCISPVGTAALLNYFAGAAPRTITRPTAWSRSSTGRSTAWSPRPARSSAATCAIATSRRAMYLLSGALTALCGLAMMALAAVADDLRHRRQRLPVHHRLLLRGVLGGGARDHRQGRRRGVDAVRALRVVRQPRHRLRRLRSTRASTTATDRAACSASTPRSTSLGIVALGVLFQRVRRLQEAAPQAAAA